MKLKVIFKNKETGNEEEGELNIHESNIACLYKDMYGTFVVTHGGRSYKVKHTLEELEALL